MKRWKLVSALLTVMMLGLVLTACGKKASKPLTGVYKTADKAEDGTEQPNYWYFKKNGTFMYCTPQVDSTNDGSDTDYWYGDASRGTWKSLGNNRYQLKMHDVYDNDYYQFKGHLKGNKFYTSNGPKNAKYEWDADVSVKQSAMTYSDYMDMFNKAKVSDQKKIQDNGYDKPDNDDSSSTDSTDNETVGVMAALLASPDWFKDGVNSGSMYYGNDDSDMGDSVKGFSYITSNGDPTSYLYFKQDGNNVTIKQWTSEGADSVADGHYKTTTVSLSRLKKDYYVSQSQKSEVQGYVNKLKPYSEAN